MCELPYRGGSHVVYKRVLAFVCAVGTTRCRIRQVGVGEWEEREEEKVHA